MTLEEFKAATCARSACWARESFEDAGIVVNLGSGWSAFMLDEHFSNKHKCIPKSKGGRRGGFCDAIGVPDQNPNCRYRLIEAKAGGMSASTGNQLQKGAAYLESILGECCRAALLSVEVYTRSVPAVTNRRRTWVKFCSGRVSVQLIS